MAKKAYIGVNGVARKVKKIYAGVNDIARKVKKVYIGVAGVARPCWSGGELAYYGKATALSRSRRYLAATTVGGYALFGGGLYYSDALATVDAYNASLVRSTPSALSEKRRNLAATAVGDFALFGGGESSYEHDTVDVYVIA